MSGRFAVFDVETPNARSDRMSAIGLTLVQGGEITASYATLVNPEDPFDRFNIWLTGSTPEAVADKPTFAELWPRLKPLLEGRVLVAHNATFDLGVLARCLEHYGLTWQARVPYLCTVQLSRRLQPELANHKLDTVARALGLELTHHQADSDSRACAGILLHHLRAGADIAPFLRSYDLAARRTVRR